MAKTADNPQRKKSCPLVFGVLIATLTPALSGCFPGDGKLERNPEITRSFVTYQTLQNHKYYYLGYDYVAIAIAAIHRDYELLASSWKAVDFSMITLDQLIDRMLHRDGATPHGSYIFDQNGKKMGVWYSSIYGATIKIDEGKQITLLAPLWPDAGEKR